MARSRRRMMRTKRERTDWVYRSDMYGLRDGGNVGGQSLDGTYDWDVRSLTSGQATAQVLWLVDAADRELSLAAVADATATLQSRAAKPEQKRTQVRAVEGVIYFEPTTWAVGNLMAIGVRIAAFEQDINTGQAVVDGSYTMWRRAGANGPERMAASIYANDRQLNMYERRMWKAFASNNEALMVMKIRARLRWSLPSHHGLALWLEGENTGVNVRYQTWLRTLVVR